jgi:hypothetical protein
MNRRTRPVFFLVPFACAAALLAAPAAARQGISADDIFGDAQPAAKDIRPPAPAEPDKHSPIVPYALTLLLAGAAIGLAVMPSHRTHQD